MSHIIAPAVLAVYALNLSRISVMDTATLLFGYFLAEKLDPPSLFWGFIATLVAAVFYGYGALLPAAFVHNLPLHGLRHCSPAPLQSSAAASLEHRSPMLTVTVECSNCAASPMVTRAYVCPQSLLQGRRGGDSAACESLCACRHPVVRRGCGPCVRNQDLPRQ